LHLAGTAEIKLCFRDAAGALQHADISAVARNFSGKSVHAFGEFLDCAYVQRQPMAIGVAACTLFPAVRPRTGAPARVTAVGRNLALASHQVAAGFLEASSTRSTGLPSMIRSAALRRRCAKLSR